jgi:hypothetical protein
MRNRFLIRFDNLEQSRPVRRSGSTARTPHVLAGATTRPETLEHNSSRRSGSCRKPRRFCRGLCLVCRIRVSSAAPADAEAANVFDGLVNRLAAWIRGNSHPNTLNS